MTARHSIAARLRQLLLYRAEYNFLKRQQQTIADALATAPADGIGRLHLALLRKLRVTWLPLESGAPGLRQFLPCGKDNSTLKAGAQLIGHRDETLLARALVETAQLIPDF
ncbi:MAG: hypothetical protein ABW202_02125 [Duganella sp.]